MGTEPTEQAIERDEVSLSLMADALQRLRACVRVPLLFVWTLGWFGIRMAVRPVAALSAGAQRTMRRSILRAWATGACAILGARITIHGAAPPPPFLLVSNHLSYLDVIVYARLLGCVFVSMIEVGAWPLIGTLARGVNTLFIDRTRRSEAARVNREIARTLERGHGLTLFPESTTTYGDKVLPFHGALLQPAIDLQRPVHHAAISYATPPDEAGAENAICWVDDTPFATHALRLLRLRRIDVTVTFGKTPMLESNRKELATALHSAVESDLFGSPDRKTA